MLIQGDDKMDLKECRIEIDRIDKQLVQLLEERMNVAGEVIRYKERKALPILDSGREGEKLDALACLCSEDALPYIRQIMKDIMQHPTVREIASLAKDAESTRYVC